MDPCYLIVGLTAAMFLLYGALSRRLEDGVVTAPMVCVAAGYGASLLGSSTVPLALDSRLLITAAGELALAILLFTDASGIDRVALRRDWALPATKLFMGWSGPRGIASVLYVAIVVQQFGLPGHERVFAVVVLTVLRERASARRHGSAAVGAVCTPGQRPAAARKLKNCCLPPFTPPRRVPRRRALRGSRSGGSPC